VPFHLCAHRRRVVETEQAVRVVDKHVEMVEEVLAENALNELTVGMEILEGVNEHVLVGNRAGAGFDQVELREGRRLMRSEACDHGGALISQVKLSGKRRIDHGDLGAAIQ
jgi:hypothetical protein